MRGQFLEILSTHRSALILLIFIIANIPATSFAQPTSQEQAKRAVHSWISLDRHPLDASFGTNVKDVLTFNDDNAAPLYHIVNMEPQGFVIVAGDDLVEPIIGFVPKGEYNPSLDNPLGALVTQDVPARIKRARELEKQGKIKGTDYLADSHLASAKKKWSLLDRAETLEPIELGLATISDVRVAPLLQSNWNQTTESGGEQCYNLYTPNNYPSGCVATAFAQIMRFFQFPTAAVGTPSFDIYVDSIWRSESLLGGNGTGGAYNWAIMDYGPAVTLADHRIAIGRLTHDTGATVNMSYTSSASGTDTLKISDALKSTFGYSNAKKGYNSLNNLPTTERNNMVNPNLDAGYPVAFGITGTYGGHAIVGDGYGYNSSTLYHHLNMGWSGDQNAWYNLPNIDDAYYGFTSIYKCVYNIFTSGSGEIISGRVVDAAGKPLAGVTVQATRAGEGTYSDITDSKGIYALSKIPSASTYQVSASKTGFVFSSQPVSTLTSTDSSTVVGNKWGIDFISETFSPFPWSMSLPAITAGAINN